MPVFEEWFRYTPKVRIGDEIMALGPVQESVAGSNSQPLFSTAHLDSSASILSIVMALSF